MSNFLMGTDVLGSDVVGATTPAAQGPFVTIHVKNAPELVAKQGGSIGSLAFGLVPQTITNKIYTEMASEIGKGMREKGVDADIKVVGNLPAVRPLSQDFTVGALIGAGGVGIGYGIFRLVKHFLGRK